MKPFVLVVGLLLAAGCSSRTTSPLSSAAIATLSPVASGPSGAPSVDPNYAPALAEAELVRAMLPTLPDATSTTSAPVAELAAPIVSKRTHYVIDLTAFWTAPGDTADAISYLQTHRPPDTGTFPGQYAGPIEQSGVAAKDDPEYLTYVVPGLTDPGQISFEVLAHGADVAVRADVEVLWHATKPSSEYLGAVRSVDVLILRPGQGAAHLLSAPTIRRTLTGAQAQRLANAIDATPIQNIVGTSCPGGETGASDVLTFHTVRRTVEIHDSVDNCDGISVTADGKKQPTLGGSINSTLVDVLDLPSKYDQ